MLVVPRCVVSIVPIISAAVVVVPIVVVAIKTIVPEKLIGSSAEEIVAAWPPSSAEVRVPCTSKDVSSALIFQWGINQIILSVSLFWKVKT